MFIFKMTAERRETAMNKKSISALFLVFLLPGSAFAGDFEELTAICESCHGPAGASPHSDVPIIGGQSQKYIRGSLESFQVWGRPCVKSLFRTGDISRPKTDMCKIAGGLSKEDIQLLGDHYSSQPWVAAPQTFDASRVEAGAALHQQNCETCHEQGGTAVSIGPKLAGQWAPYLRSSLKFVPSGEHMVPPPMENNLEKLSEDDIGTLLNYYASQQN
jgi:sulfide dehydrogenase cytochrome subunit